MDDLALYNMSDEELEKEFIKLRSEGTDDTTDSNDSTTEETIQDTTDTSITTDVDNDTPSEVSTTDDPDSLEHLQDEDSINETQVGTTYKVKANGKDYDFTIEELQKLASMGMDYTKKTQAIKPYRKMISAIQENNLNDNDINLFIDIKKGNKEALSSLVKSLNVDIFDLPDDSTDYTPTSYGVDETAQELNEVVGRLQQDSEFAHTQEIIVRLDNESKDFLVNNPKAIELLHIDKKNGTFDKVMPIADKMAAIDGYSKPILEYYIAAGQQYSNTQNQLNEAKAKEKLERETQTKISKKNAGLPQSRIDRGTPIQSYLDIDDDDYLRWYKSLGN